MQRNKCLGSQLLSTEVIRALIECVIACKLDNICTIHLAKGFLDYTIVRNTEYNSIKIPMVKY